MQLCVPKDYLRSSSFFLLAVLWKAFSVVRPNVSVCSHSYHSFEFSSFFFLFFFKEKVSRPSLATSVENIVF